jgi:CRISPR-associated protein Cmr5
MNEAERPNTRSQRYAQRAFSRIQERAEALKEEKKKRKEFAGFAKRFPTLIHTCGLCQALAFAQAKGEAAKEPNAYKDYLTDLVDVLTMETDVLLGGARRDPITKYMHLSREAIAAAGWLKRYAEALITDEEEEQQETNDAGVS